MVGEDWFCAVIVVILYWVAEVFSGSVSGGRLSGCLMLSELYRSGYLING